MRPGHPGQRRPRLRHALETGVVLRDLRRLAGQRRCVPRPAHDGDPRVALPPGRPENLAHMRLAAQRGLVGLRGDLPQELDRLGQRVERIPFHSQLDDVLPPSLRVLITGQARQLRDRVGPHRLGRAPSRDICALRTAIRQTVRLLRTAGAARAADVGDELLSLHLALSSGSGVGLRPSLLPLGLPLGQDDGSGQIHETDPGPVRHRPGQRLPLGGEDGHRPEGGLGGIGVVPGEQSHRRLQAPARPLDEAIGVGRPLDEDAVGPIGLQRRGQGPSRARAVVTDPQDSHGRAHVLGTGYGVGLGSDVSSGVELCADSHCPTSWQAR